MNSEDARQVMMCYIGSSFTNSNALVSAIFLGLLWLKMNNMSVYDLFERFDEFSNKWCDYCDIGIPDVTPDNVEQYCQVDISVSDKPIESSEPETTSAPTVAVNDKKKGWLW